MEDTMKKNTKYAPIILIATLLVVTIIFGTMSYVPDVVLAQEGAPPTETINPEPISENTSSSSTQTVQQAEEFWTDERMAAAQPVPDWVIEQNIERAKASVNDPAVAQTELLAVGSPYVSSPVLPGTGGHGSAAVYYQVPGGSGTTPNFSYPFAYNSGLVAPSFYGFYPWRVNGKIFFTNSDYGPGTFVCSGTIVTSGANGNRNLVLTAAHCVHSGGVNGTEGTFSDNVVFHPGYRDGASPQGAWPSATMWVKSNWATHTNMRQDYAFIEVQELGWACGSLANCFGAQGVAWNQAQLREFWATGYPAESPYTGQRQHLCTASTAKRDLSMPGAGYYDQGVVPMGIGCNMTGGSSGGSWVIRGNMSNGGFANSVNSYKYTYPSQPAAMYGSYFDSNFGSLWESARQ